jgi:predicted flap endonuclease-1-like 5' DNA nuclease
MSIILDKKNWAVDNQQVRAKKGKLVRVQIRPGQFVKMYEVDAIAKGYIKGKPQAENKMRLPTENKAVLEEAPEEKPQADDFTTIPGIGIATARALTTHGITTFEQLKAAGDLPYLTTKGRESVAAWRAANG